MISRYKLLIKGRSPDYFIEKLIKNNISIYKLKKTKEELIIVIDESDYELIQKLKANYKITILNKYGLVKVKDLIKKYMFFIIAFFIGIGINITLSNIIFSIDVVHSNPYIRNIIYNDLEEAGIKKYHLKKSFKKKEEIISNILKKETNDIEWLEIENIGTKYIVRVEQRKKNKKEKKCRNRNIIAKKQAMILSIEATTGEVVKKKLDYVEKGDVLISGLIHNKEEIVSKKCATGKVYGEVWYKIKLELPINYKEENLTGRSKKHIELSFLNNNYALFNKYKTYKRKKSTIIKSKLLPISINYTNYLETKLIKEKYELNKVNNKAINMAVSKLKSKLNKQDKIIYKKVLKKQQKNSKIIVDVFIKTKEDITDTESIENIDIEKENAKNSKEQ